MEKLLKMEKYQFLHNFVYWCGMIGIFVLGFFTGASRAFLMAVAEA